MKSLVDQKLAEELKNRINERSTKIADLKLLSQQEKDQLNQELLKDHQKCLFVESEVPEDQKEKWQIIREEIEKQQQKITQQETLIYQKKTKKLEPKQTVLKNALLAFIVGGLICTGGQLILNGYSKTGLAENEAQAATSATLIFIAAFLTGVGIYDEIGRFAGAGSIVPITGFANSITSSAMEFRREGFIYGVGARLFTVAGPVIVYGTAVSILIGLIYYFF